MKVVECSADSESQGEYLIYESDTTDDSSESGTGDDFLKSENRDLLFSE